jgi:exosortase
MKTSAERIPDIGTTGDEAARLNGVQDSASPRRRQLWVTASVAILAVLWAHRTTFEQLVERWSHNPDYSHGFLVPIFAGFLLWVRRQKLDLGCVRTSWWGVVLLIVGGLLRLTGAYFYVDFFDHISLLPTIAGLVLVVGGPTALRWSWPAIACLVFMMPMPYRLERAMAYPLQRIATQASTYAMQTLGLPALSEGNTILLDEVRIGVVEACSGLRMLVVFFALSSAVALLIDRPLWERCLVFLSAVPIALVSNVTRITLTGVIHATLGSDVANWVFHDLAGWLMMPLALAMLWVELRLLSRLVIVPAATMPLPLEQGERVPTESRHRDRITANPKP